MMLNARANPTNAMSLRRRAATLSTDCGRAHSGISPIAAATSERPIATANITSIGVEDRDESAGEITALAATGSRCWLDVRGGVKCTDAWTRLRRRLAVRSPTCRA